MDWMVEIARPWLTTVEQLVGLTIVFAVLVRLMPCNPGMYWWKDLRAAATDLVYWLIVPLFLQACRLGMLLVGARLLFGESVPTFATIRGLPFWVQIAMALVIQDVLLYWIHRLFHRDFAWKFHAIHHSPTMLDWLSTARFHPVNNLLAFTLTDVAVLLMGVSPDALLVLAPFNVAYSAMVHANLNWTFGPFRYVLASPVFHRWHHTSEEEGLNKNFASTFPILDVVFGTFYMPRGVVPAHFGTGKEEVPRTFWGQFFYPFRREPEAVAVPAPWWMRWGWRVVLAGLGVFCLLGGGSSFLAWKLERDRPPEATPAVAQSRTVAPVPLVAAPQLERGHAVLGVGVSADGRRIVSGGEDGLVRVWGEAGELPPLRGHGRSVRTVAISRDGKWIVSGGFDRTVKLWDAQSGQEKCSLAQESGVLCVAINSTGSRFVSACADGTVKLYEANSCQALHTWKSEWGAVPSVALSGDGKQVAFVCADGAIRVCDGTTGRETCSLRGHTSLVYCVAISDSGREVVSGSFDETVKIWDLETRKEKRTLRGHVGPVYGVSVAADGRVLSGGKDGKVLVWDAENARTQTTLTGHTGPVSCVAASADGQRIVSGSHDHTVKVWNAGAH